MHRQWDPADAGFREGGRMDVKTEKGTHVKPQRIRTVNINIRATQAEKREIERCSSVLGMSQTELLMSGVKIISGMIEKHKNAKGKKTEGRTEADGKGAANAF